MQGSWLITSLYARGREQEESGVARLVIKGDTAGFIKRPGKKPDEFKVKLDSSKTPKTIDLVDRGKVSVGIYEFDGDTLKICYRERGEARPQYFDPKKESKIAVMMVLKRELPEQKPAKDPDKPKEPQANAGPAPLDLLLPKKKLAMVPKDEYEMVGTWSVNGIVADGEPRDPGDMRIQFGPFHSMTVQDPSLSPVATSLRFKLEPETRVIELTAGGKSQIGIYRLASYGPLGGPNINMLTICVNEKGNKAPKEFRADKGSGNALFQLVRRSYDADTKWGEKLFPAGLIIDFGKVAGNGPKSVKVKIKNPYPLPVWISGGYAGGLVDTAKWLTQKWPNRSGPVEPGEEITVEFTLHPGFLPLNGGNPFDRRGSQGVRVDTIPFTASLKNYRPRTDPVPRSTSNQMLRRATGQPESVVYLKITGELSMGTPK